MFEQDFIKRVIRQLVEAASRAMGLAPKQSQESLEVIAAAKRQLPFVPGMIDSLGPGTVMQMLGSPDAALALFRLYDAEAEAHERLGHIAPAERCRRRAVLFYLRSGTDDREARARAQGLALRLSPGQLSPEQLAGLGM